MPHFTVIGEHKDNFVLHSFDVFDAAFGVRSILIDSDDRHSDCRRGWNFLVHQSAIRRMDHLVAIDTRVSGDRLRVDWNANHIGIFLDSRSKRIQRHSRQPQSANDTDSHQREYAQATDE